MEEKDKVVVRAEIILKSAGIPKRFMVTEYDNANKQINEYISKIAKNVQAGHGLYIWGDTGTGKSVAACAVLKKYAQVLAKGSVFSLCPIYYINIPNFLNEWKRDWDRFGEDKITPSMIEAMKEADLVVFDDVAINVKGLDERERNVIYEVINTRVEDMKASIFTSNNDPYNSEAQLGKQLYSRIITANAEVEMAGKDKRGGA
jgi:DNA replication protein DnaC